MSKQPLQQWLNTPNDQASQNINNWMLEGIKIGMGMLNIETGIISKIDGTDYIIRQVSSTMGDIFSPGDKFELCDTYCAAVSKQDKTVTYIQVGAIPEMLIHPVYKAVQLESYIGSPIHDRSGNVTGTVNFSSHEIRNSEFTSKEIELVESISKKVGEVLYQ